MKEQMVRQAAEVEIVRESDALLGLGGVGCQLLYLTPEQRAQTELVSGAPTTEIASRDVLVAKPQNSSSEARV